MAGGPYGIVRTALPPLDLPAWTACEPVPREIRPRLLAPPCRWVPLGAGSCSMGGTCWRPHAVASWSSRMSVFDASASAAERRATMSPNTPCWPRATGCGKIYGSANQRNQYAKVSHSSSGCFAAFLTAVGLVSREDAPGKVSWEGRTTARFESVRCVAITGATEPRSIRRLRKMAMGILTTAGATQRPRLAARRPALDETQPNSALQPRPGRAETTRF